ncbi:unnamed protein product, partial [Urochloa humidicola]
LSTWEGKRAKNILFSHLATAAARLGEPLGGGHWGRRGAAAVGILWAAAACVVRSGVVAGGVERRPAGLGRLRRRVLCRAGVVAGGVEHGRRGLGLSGVAGGVRRQAGATSLGRRAARAAVGVQVQLERRPAVGTLNLSQGSKGRLKRNDDMANVEIRCRSCMS